jgi:putative phage-type endonuclease
MPEKNFIEIKQSSRPGKTVMREHVDDMQESVKTDRCKYIGGSDAGAMLGLNAYKSAYTLWAEKTGLVSDEIPDNDAMRTGRDLEQYVAERWMDITGKKCRRDNFRYTLKEYSFMIGHIDRSVVGENSGLECKTANSFQNSMYENGEFPDSYYAQCQHYMAVTGAERWYLAVFCFPHIYTFEIQRNEKEIDALINEEKKFWFNNVLAKVAPEIDETDSTSETIKEMYPADSTKPEDTIANLEGITEGQLQQYRQIKDQIKELKDLQEKLENQFKSAMGEYQVGRIGEWTLKWKASTKSDIDRKRLKEERPDIYDHYKIVTNNRRFSTESPEELKAKAEKAAKKKEKAKKQ